MKNITFLGSGNVATHFSVELQKKGYNIIQIWSKTKKSAQELSSKLNCEWTINLADLIKTDLIIISIKDDAIKQVISEIRDKNIPIIHTSGTTNIDVFKDNKTCGVIYPLQTLNKKTHINLNEIPLFIEANNKRFEEVLFKIAEDLNKNSITIMKSSDRKVLHLAAIFACNFSNHMITISESITEGYNLDFEVLKPIINQTFKNIQNQSPRLSQTGPAIRRDLKMIQEHLKILKNKPELKALYSLISENIIKHHE